MPYEWKVDKSGYRRYVRVDGDRRIERISEAPRGGEMKVESPDAPVAEAVVPVVEAAAVSVPKTKAPVKRRGTRKKKS